MIQPTPDLILHNCKLFQPSLPQSPRNSALAIKNERIVAIGNDDDILHLAGAATRKINGRQRWVLPALLDSHTHLCTYAARKLQIDLSQCDSLESSRAKVKEKIISLPEGRWIVGYGWDKNRWVHQEYPDKRVLDELSQRHFISLQSKDWHSLWVNSAVLQACGIDETTADPPGGLIIRYRESQEPSGILKEKACDRVFQCIAPLSLDELYPALKETFAEYHRLGITGAHSMETPYEFAHYNRLYNEGKLGLRIFWYFPVKYLKQEDASFRMNLGNSFLKICGAKLFVDGTLGSQTAEMLEAFAKLGHKGIEVMSRQQLGGNIRMAVNQKLSCAIHAIGDGANRKTLRTLEAFREASGVWDLRHRIEHAQLLHQDDIPLFNKYRVIASMQPIHLAADIPLIEKYWGNRGRYAYAFNSLWESGATLIFGSDTPVETFDPWKGLYVALERKNQCDPAGVSFYAEEKIKLEQALLAYTQNSAYAVFEENHLGALQIGKLADLILIDQDIFNQPPERMLETRVLLTIQAGRTVHDTVSGA